MMTHSDLPHAAPRAQLIGRERDLAEARERLLVSHERLLTLTGPGGCGKTSLALQVAADVRCEFNDGVRVVELAAVADPALIAPTLASVLGVRSAPEQSLTAAIVSYLRDRELLLVLDNCEHLVDACAVYVNELLDACPMLCVLVTSREPLMIAGERRQRVQPLPVPEADSAVALDELRNFAGAQLFVDRAQAAHADFRLTEANAPAVAAICAKLDGIPLGIELAAARVRVVTVEQILARMDDWFGLLASSQRSAPTRQQTLKATLDWSFDLLSADERTAFMRMSVFTGGWSVEAFESQLAGELPAGAALDVLTRLVDKSLVQVDGGGETARYRMLEPVRQYSYRLLLESGQVTAARERQAYYCLELAEQAGHASHGPRQVEWFARLEREQGNLRAALEWIAQHQTEDLLRLAVALAPFWEARGHYGEGRRWLELALSAEIGDFDPILRAQALTGAGRIAHQQTDFVGSQRLHTESLEVSRASRYSLGVAMSLSEQGKAARMLNEYEHSESLLVESLQQSFELDHRPASAYALLNLGITKWSMGDVTHADELLTESLRLYREEEDLRHMTIALAMLGLVAWQAGHLAAAAQRFIEALEGHLRIEDWWFVVYDLRGSAAVLLDHGLPERAAVLLGAAQVVGEALGDVLSPIGGTTWVSLTEQVQQRLGPDAFDTNWALGRSLSRDEIGPSAVAALAVVEHGLSPARSPEASAAADTLTHRQREVARLLALGYSDRQIAEELAIAVSTTGVHVHHILEKLELRSRWQVADWAVQHGLAERDAPTP